MYTLPTLTKVSWGWGGWRRLEREEGGEAEVRMSCLRQE